MLVALCACLVTRSKPVFGKSKKYLNVSRRSSPVLLLAFLPFISSCGGNTLSVLFDIPERGPDSRPQQQSSYAGSVWQEPEKVVTPEQAEVREKIISAKTWEEARELLPLDRPGKKGKVNWTEAVKTGVIDPLPSKEGPPPREIIAFKYDFYYPAPETDPGFEVYFPHSTHTEWVGCDSCHPKIFPIRGGVELSKSALKKGKLCGVCHRKSGGTAFWLKSCDRCHPNAED